MHRARSSLLAALALAALGGCDEKPKGEAPARFAGVTRPAANPNAPAFCEKTWEPGKGPVVALPPLEELAADAPPPATKGWRWVNLWATWCGPCVEEMGLLASWHDALGNDGLPVAFELLSIDEADAEPKLRTWLAKDLAGPVRWMRPGGDLPGWLAVLGIPADSAIPIHVVVAPDGRARCVRVGALHAQDYGAVKALIAAGRQ